SLRFYSPSTRIQLAPIRLTDRVGFLFEEQIVTFLNSTLFIVIAALCAFIGLYILILWINRPQEQPNLWYALSSLFIAFYFVEIGSSFTILPYLVNRALAKASLSISMASLVQFFISFCRIRVPRLLSWSLIIIPLIITVAFLAVQNDMAAVTVVFNNALLFVQFSILFITIVTVRSVIQGNKEAIPLLVGVILGLGFGTHDVVYSMLGEKPLVWLQGIGFFCLNLSLFVSLTYRSTKMHTELEQYSQEVQETTEQLRYSIQKIEETTKTLSDITLAIDTDAGTAARSAETLAQGAGQIQKASDRQMQAMLESRHAVQHFSQSLEQVNKDVERQAQGIRSSAESVAVVADSVADMAVQMEQTAQTARQLEQTSESGLAASQEMADAIDKIRAVSGTIVDIVGAVEDFAEQTNLLAMNAAIEAAHSGAAGKGFAVIAAEIKKLAGASAERSKMIRDSIQEITKRIETGVVANQRMIHLLKTVAEGAQQTLNSIVTIGNALAAQRTASEQLRSNLGLLSDTADEIRLETEKQEQEGRRLQDRIEELMHITESLKHDIAGIVQENEGIVQMIQELASVSAQGKAEVLSLKSLLGT
ncbi:MAG: methyl-accepting chemotaxis protein, partial [Termitinemataceae bacterium]